MLKYTGIGAIAVLIWGTLLPLSRIVQEQVGSFAYVGLVYLFSGFVSLASQGFKIPVAKSVWRHPSLYLRWACFVLHEGTVCCAINLVSLENVPIVLLINYLWPTAIILCSVVIAGVKVHRRWAFVAGTCVVILSLGVEFLGGAELSAMRIFSLKEYIVFLATFCGAISWGLYSAISRKYGEESGGAHTMPLFQLTLGLFLPLSLLPRFHHEWALNDQGAIVLAFTCTFQVIAYLAWDKGVRFGNIVILSLLADFIPWISLTTAALALGTPITERTVLSAVMLVFGAILTRYGTLARKGENF